MFCKPFHACLSLTLAAALAVSPVTAWAEVPQEKNTPKEEVIYVNLKTDGSVDQIYVVNQFDLTGQNPGGRLRSLQQRAQPHHH